MINIRIQEADFDHSELYNGLRSANTPPGAVVTFTGLVRDFSSHGDVQAIYLEHYPAMTEKTLHKIAVTAQERWQLENIVIVHRVGKITAREQIVFVGVASLHRKEAFQACEYIMDYLKNDAPFWKKEITPTQELWVESKRSDSEALDKWC